MEQSAQTPFEDPLSYFTRAANTFRRLWMRWTYPFIAVGSNFRVHYTCDLHRRTASGVKLGNEVWLDRDVWINTPIVPERKNPVIVIEDGCKIGRRCVISAKNLIHLEKNVVFGPSVLLMDHNHAYDNINVAVVDQGITAGGEIRIGEGCWIGFGAAIICNQGDIVIGKNSVIGANAVVTKSVPPHSIVTGNPGRVVKQFDPTKGEWALGFCAHAKEATMSHI